MANPIKPTRGSRAGFNSLVAASGLSTGQIYAILDEKWLALATGPAAYIEVGRGGINVPSAALVAAIRAGTGTGYLAPPETWSALAPVALADAATIALDLATGINFTVTLGGNRTLGNPSNAKPGQQGTTTVSRAALQTLSFGVNWRLYGNASLPTASGKGFKVVYDVITSSLVHGQIIPEL